MTRVLNTFFGGIYSANEHRGHERAVADAALVTAIWLAFVLMTALLCVLSAIGHLSPISNDNQEIAFAALALVLVGVSWVLIRRLGDAPLTGPRITLDTFLKKRTFGIGCVAIPIVLIFIARTLMAGSMS